VEEKIPVTESTIFEIVLFERGEVLRLLEVVVFERGEALLLLVPEAFERDDEAVREAAGLREEADTFARLPAAVFEDLADVVRFAALGRDFAADVFDLELPEAAEVFLFEAAVFLFEAEVVLFEAAVARAPVDFRAALPLLDEGLFAVPEPFFAVEAFAPVFPAAEVFLLLAADDVFLPLVRLRDAVELVAVGMVYYPPQYLYC
jgi:hypothetical protein